MALANLRRLRERGKGFGDFELRVEPDYFVHWNRDYAEAMRSPPHRAAILFAKDGSGGHIGITGPGDDDDGRPVVLFSSEGEFVVLGENFDDFLALVAGNFTDEDFEHFGADSSFRTWVKGLGLTPHERPEAHLVKLAERTAEIESWFWDEVRSRDRHEAVLELVPRVRFGSIPLDTTIDALAQHLGLPSFAVRPTTVQITPYLIEFTHDTRIIWSVTVYRGVPIVRIGAFEPFHATAEEVETWLRERDRRLVVEDSELWSPELGVQFKLDRPFPQCPKRVLSVRMRRPM